MRYQIVVAALVSFGLAGRTFGHPQIDAEPNRNEPLKLEPVFSDDFGKDTRAAYTTRGEVSWQPGQLTLNAGASLERAIDADRWAVLRLHWKLPAVSGQQARAVAFVRFLVSGRNDTSYCVRFRRHQAEGRLRTSLALLVGTGAGDQLVREVQLDQASMDAVSIELRYGLVRVLAGEKPLLLSHSGELGARVASIRLEAPAAPIELESLAVRAFIPPPRQITDEQQTQYAESESLAFTLVNFGEQIPFADQEQGWRKVIHMQRSLLGERDPRLAISLTNFALTYRDHGNYSRSAALTREAAQVHRAVLGPEHPVYAITLYNLAEVNRVMGDFTPAVRQFRQAADVLQGIHGTNHVMYAACMSNLGGLFYELGDEVQAVAHTKKAAEIMQLVVGERHKNYLTALHNLAALYAELQRYAEAEPLFLKVIQLDKELFGEQHRNYASAISNLGIMYADQQDYKRAEPLVRQAAEIRKSIMGSEHPDYAWALCNLAIIYRRTGRHEKAEPLYRTAVGIFRRQLDANAVVQSARQQYRNQERRRAFLDDRVANALELAELRPAELAADVWMWKGAITRRQRAYRTVAGDPELAPLFADLKSVTQELAAESGRIPVAPPATATKEQAAGFQHMKQAWEERIRELTEYREKLEQQIAAGSRAFQRLQEPLSPEQIQAALPEQTAFVDFLQYYDATPDPHTSGKAPAKPRFLALIVRRDEPTQVESFDAAVIEPRIDAFRRWATQSDALTSQDTAAARELRSVLWEPLARHLAGVETVIISPDTSLGRLPFAALPGKAKGRYLIEEYKFASIPLAEMFRSLNDDAEREAVAQEGLLVVGDIDFNAAPRIAPAANNEHDQAEDPPKSVAYNAGRWQSLPGFQQELVIVRDHFRKRFADGVTTLRGQTATEGEFIRQAPRHRHLHLITHGYFADPELETAKGLVPPDLSKATPHSSLAAHRTISRDLPGLLSGIVLTGANRTAIRGSKADGVLTASEIEALNLNGVDLVVLSACETGLGKAAGGEGLTGLQRAFHIAGASSSLATLWQVDDKATQEFMSRFYRYYWLERQPRIDAVRNAQLDILHNPALTGGGSVRGKPRTVESTGSDRTHPRYWAAFQLSGDWR